MAKGAVRSVNIYVNNKEALRSMDELKKKIEAETRAWQRMAKGTNEYYAKAAEISRMQDALERERDLIKSVTEKRQKGLMQIGLIGSALTGLVQTVQMLGQGIQKVRDLASDMAGLDDAMGRVRKTTNLTRQEVQELNKEITKIDTRTSREELNELAYAAGKLGVSGKEDVLEFVRAADVINVALGDVLGGTDAIIEVTKLAQVFKGTTKEIQQAGLEETLIRTGSVINELGKTSTANEGQIEKFLMRIASYASIAGMSLDQMAGLGSVLSQNSKAPEMSATAVTKIMQQMIKKTGSFAEMIGMGEKELSDLMAKDFNQAFLAVLQKLHDIGDVQTIVPIFKDLGADATRASQVILALSTNIDKVREAQETANKAIKEGTSMNKEYNVMNETLQAQMEKAKKTVFDARVELGEKLYPYIIKYTFFGGKVIKWLSKLTEHGENAFMALAVAAAVAANKIAKNWNGLKDKISQLSPVLEWNEMKAAQKRYKEAEEEITMVRRRQAELQQQIERSRQREAAMQENLNNLEAQRESIAKGRDARTQAEYAINKEIEISKKVSLGLENEMSASVARTTTLKKSLQDSENRILALKLQGKASEAEMNWELQNKARIENALAIEEKKQLLTNAQISKEKALQKSLEAQKNVMASTTLTKEEKIAQINSIIAQQEKDILRTKEVEAGVRAQINALMQREVVLEKEMEALKGKTKFTSLLKNHWMLILTVLIEVALYIAKIVKEQNKFRKELNKTYEDTIKNTQTERMEAEWLFSALGRANTAEEERLRIMKQLNEKYGDYLRNLTDEEGRILNIEAAHRAVIDAIIAENNAKGFSKAKEQMGEKYGTDMQNSLSMMYDQLKNSTINGEKITDKILSEIWKNVNDMIGKNYREDQIRAYLHRSGVDFGAEWAGGYSGVAYENEDTFFSAYASYVNTKKKYDKDLTEQQRLYNMELESSEERLQRLTNMYTQLQQQYESAPNDKEKADRKKEMDAYLNDIAAAFEDKMLKGHDLSRMGWSDLALLEKWIEQQMKAIKGTTAWTKKLEGAQRALKRVQEQMKKVQKGGGSGPTTTGLPEDEESDPLDPTSSGEGKSPDERWEDILKKIKALNDKYDLKETPISKAKQQVIEDFQKMESEAAAFARKFPAYSEKAAEEIERIEAEMWRQIERIDTEEREKRLQKIDDNLSSVTEKLDKFKLKQRRKHQTQLETDLEEIENDFSKLRDKAEKEREALQNRKDAGNVVTAMFDLSGDSDMVDQLMEHYKQLLSKFGVTAESWANAIKQNPKNAQDLLTLLGLDFNDEDQRTLDAIIGKIDELDTAKIAEIQNLASERAREIVTELSDTATRQYREAMKTIEDQIKTLEVAMQYLQKHNYGGDNDERIKEIEKTLAFLKNQKSDLTTKYNTGFGKDSWAALFGIDEKNWDNWGNNWEDNLEKMTDKLKTFADNVFELWSSIDSIMQNQAEAEMQRTNELYDSKSAALKKQLDSGMISQKRYDAQMEKMQKEKEKKEKKLKHDAFERERAANLIQGAVNLALTISSIYAKEPGGLIIKSAAAAIAAAVQAVQIAAIASQPNPYARGGYIESLQYAMMGEEGPEWVASNKLLRDRQTKPIIEALNEYQQGDTNALDRITMPAPALKNVSQAIPSSGRNFAASNTTNYYYQAEGINELLKETRQMNEYLKDPRNRRSYITRELQLEFERQEEEVRAAARM